MLSISEEGKAQYTPEQQAYIVKYAAGLLISWTAEHIGNLITLDVGDGFDGPETDKLFPDPEKEEEEGKEPLLWEAHGEVVTILEEWFDSLAKQVGFEPVQTPYGSSYLNGITVQGTKYPTLPR